MSVLDKTWYWSTLWGGVGVIVVDPVDTILERLSVRYLDEARAVAAAEFESFLDRPVDLAPAFFHPAHNNWFPDSDPTIRALVPDFDRWGAVRRSGVDSAGCRRGGSAV